MVGKFRPKIYVWGSLLALLSYSHIVSIRVYMVVYDGMCWWKHNQKCCGYLRGTATPTSQTRRMLIKLTIGWLACRFNWSSTYSGGLSTSNHQWGWRRTFAGTKWVRSAWSASYTLYIKMHSSMFIHIFRSYFQIFYHFVANKQYIGCIQHIHSQNDW